MSFSIALNIVGLKLIKDTLRSFPIEAKLSTRCGGPAWWKTCKQNPKSALRWLDRRSVPGSYECHFYFLRGRFSALVWLGNRQTQGGWFICIERIGWCCKPCSVYGCRIASLPWCKERTSSTDLTGCSFRRHHRRSRHHHHRWCLHRLQTYCRHHYPRRFLQSKRWHVNITRFSTKSWILNLMLQEISE